MKDAFIYQRDDGLVHIVDVFDEEIVTSLRSKVWVFTFCSQGFHATPRYGTITDEVPTCLECIARCP